MCKQVKKQARIKELRKKYKKMGNDLILTIKKNNEAVFSDYNALEKYHNQKKLAIVVDLLKLCNMVKHD